VQDKILATLTNFLTFLSIEKKRHEVKTFLTYDMYIYTLHKERQTQDQTITIFKQKSKTV